MAMHAIWIDLAAYPRPAWFVEHRDGSISAWLRQVMPFILRRTKEAVLHDLPPKIIQDVLCDPSPLQQALLEGFTQSSAAQQLLGANNTAQTPHIFQVCHA